MERTKFRQLYTEAKRDFGSGGRLRSLAVMDWIGKYPDDPAQKFLGENNTLSVLGQEVGHRWLAFMDIRDRTGARSDILLGRHVVEVIAGGAGTLMSGPSLSKLIDLGASVPLAQTSNGDIIGVAAGQYWRLVSAMFLHAGLLHIAFNAYALWIFGTVVEQELGRVRFLLIYFATGITASAASYAFGPDAVGVGASGAIFGIFGAFVTYNYRRRHLAIAAARLRSAVTIVVINMVLALSIQGIDWRAHVGGFLAGLFAGFAAEGSGTPSARRTILVAGFVGLIGVALALVAWRTSQLRAEFPSLF